MSDPLATPWTVAPQAPLSMGFSRQEHWTGLPFPTPGDLPDSGIEPKSPPVAGGFSTAHPLGKTLVLPQVQLIPTSGPPLRSWTEPGGPQSTKALRSPGARAELGVGDCGPGADVVTLQGSTDGRKD